jgi:MFS family permease
VQIGGGTLGDLFDAKERGKAVALYSIVVLVGPVLGPVVGGLVSQHFGWRWTFYAASIIDAVVQILGLYFLQETYAPVLLRRRQRRRDKESGTYQAPELHPLKCLRERLGQNLSRAALLLATQPIVQVLAFYNAFLYGIIYIIYATFSDLWLTTYRQTITMAGLHYISLGVGAVFAGEVSTLTNDRIYAALCARNDGKGRPEFRVPLMIPSIVTLSVGLFWYGWSAQHQLHWIMPDIGNAFFMAGAITCGISINAYIVDTYGNFSASALAAVAVLRCLAAFSFPLFAPYMYAIQVSI